ncbi:hypothetical protein PGB90_006612 [Kerria lacca]
MVFSAIPKGKLFRPAVIFLLNSSRKTAPNKTTDVALHANDAKKQLALESAYRTYSTNPKKKIYRIVSRTTQPIHAASVILIVILSMIFFPVDRKQSNFLSSRFTYFTYFTAFSLHIGFQFWMTFVSGLSLYFNLARHAFGDVQKILFPRYFTMNCVLSAVTVVQFGRLHAPSFYQWDLHTFLQLITLTLCFIVEFCIRVYFVPSVLQLISIKTSIEKSAGIGQEVGHYDLGPLLQCPHYMSIHKSFRKVHMFTAIGNIIAIMCSVFHLYFVSCKWTMRLS